MQTKKRSFHRNEGNLDAGSSGLERERNHLASLAIESLVAIRHAVSLPPTFLKGATREEVKVGSVRADTVSRLGRGIHHW